MSNSFPTLVLATVTGLLVYYILESLFFEAKAYIDGRRYERFMDDYEDDHWDDK